MSAVTSSIIIHLKNIQSRIHINIKIIKKIICDSGGWKMNFCKFTIIEHGSLDTLFSAWSLWRLSLDASSIGYWWDTAHCSSRHWMNSSKLNFFFLCFLWGHNSQKGLGPNVHRKLVSSQFLPDDEAGCKLLLFAVLKSTSEILSTLETWIS